MRLPWGLKAPFQEPTVDVESVKRFEANVGMDVAAVEVSGTVTLGALSAARLGMNEGDVVDLGMLARYDAETHIVTEDEADELGFKPGTMINPRLGTEIFTVQPNVFNAVPA